MNNFFVANVSQRASRGAGLLRLFNQGLRKLRTGHYLHPLPDMLEDMSTLEQRINYFHLLDGVLAHQVPGDVAEFGCFTGQCAELFQRVLQQHASPRQLHLYDSFEVQFTVQEPVEAVLHRTFAAAGLPQPVLHKGYFEHTLPQELPAQLAFVHIDCGFGGDAQAHRAVVRHCLEAVYPRLSAGAVCVLMDYHDKTSGDPGQDVNPGVKLACDDFLADKPERVTALYGNQFSHGFFRKAA